MARSTMSRVLLLSAVAACTVMMFPADAFSRGGGGGRGGGASRASSARSSRATTRHGPATSGSTKRSRARASDRRRDRRTDGRPATGRPAQLPARPGTRPGDRHPNTVRYHRWLRRRSGRRYSVSVWNEHDYNCTRVERVDGISYFYCDGAWFEKVYEGGEVYWVEVEKPD